MPFPTADELLVDLTPAQRRAVTVDAAPLCVLAGAGAGKTRVLTRRIAHRAATGSADPAHTLVITFTRKAAGELGARLAGLGLRDRVQAGTFHSVAAAQLRRWWADRGVTPPTLVERKARILGPLAEGRPGLAGVPVGELVGHLEWAKARCITPDRFEEAVAGGRRVLPAPAAALAALYRRYEDDKRRRGLVDFDDLLGRCAEAFDTDPAFASAQRWRWRHVLVDEFQDVNPLQHRLLLAWLGTGLDLCVVGDPAQSIYGWNGSDPRLLDTVAERWPSTTVVRLDDNHRCTPQVVAAAAAVLGEAGTRLRSSRADGPAVEVGSWASDAAEAEGVAAAVADAHRAGLVRGARLAWSDMAVLVRTNVQVGPLVEALARAGVPHRAPGRAGLLDDPVLAPVLTRWRRSPTASLQVAVADLAGAADADAGADAGAGAGAVSAGVPGNAGAEAGAVPGVGGTAGAAGAAATAVSDLLDLARAFSDFEGPATVGAFLAWVAAAGADRPGAQDAVTVCSFHRAKGLEWPAVWICGLEAGLVPIGGAASEEEERRLLYVAMTRAGRHLRLSWARTRHFRAASVPRQPSPWLRLVDPSTAGSGPPAVAPLVVDVAGWRARVEAQRARLASSPGGGRQRGRPSPRLALPDPDDDVVSALRAWRAGVARASGVPAHVVLHDRTLAALASLRPVDLDGLLAVPGVGPVKASRFGPALLEVLAGTERPAVGS